MRWGIKLSCKERKGNDLFMCICVCMILALKRKEGNEADGHGDGPWVTSVTKMKVIFLFGLLIERRLPHGKVKICTDLNSNLLLFLFSL